MVSGDITGDISGSIAGFIDTSGSTPNIRYIIFFNDLNHYYLIGVFRRITITVIHNI